MLTLNRLKASFASNLPLLPKFPCKSCVGRLFKLCLLSLYVAASSGYNCSTCHSSSICWCVMRVQVNASDLVSAVLWGTVISPPSPK